jgi:hypothetical protein
MRCMQFDTQDQAALRALDDFTISADGTATVAGEMEVVVVRPADDDGARFWLTIKFPGGETLDVRIARTPAIQRSKAPLKELAARYGLNHKTVAKWRKRAFVNDAPMGPKTPRSTVLSSEEEAIIVAFPQAYTAAAGRLPLCLAGDDPASDPVVSASVP